MGKFLDFLNEANKRNDAIDFEKGGKHFWFERVIDNRDK